MFSGFAQGRNRRERGRSGKEAGECRVQPAVVGGETEADSEHDHDTTPAAMAASAAILATMVTARVNIP